MNPSQSQSTEAADTLKAIVEKTSELPKVLATIEGRDLESSLFVEMLTKNLKPEQLPSFISASAEEIKAHAKQFIESEVNNVLIQLCASKDGYEGSADEVLKDFDRWQSSLAEADKAKFESFLESQKVSLDDYRTETGENKVQQRRLATDRWVKEKAMVGVEVDPSEVEAAYEQGKDQNCKSPNLIRVAHIPFRHTNTDETRKACKAKAEEVLKKLHDGASFDEMVKENPSSEGHLQRMGVLDFFPRGTYNEIFEKVAFTLEAGELSDIVETEEGYEIIKALEIKKGELATLAEVEAEIKQALKGQKINARIGELMDQHRPNFEIAYHL